MKKNISRTGLVFAVVALFVGMGFIPSTGQMMISKSNVNELFSKSIDIDVKTLYVGGVGEGNYSSIQDAIDDADEGYTVFVYADSSPYYENIVVNVTVDLVGEDRYTTIIDGGGIGHVVVINVDGVEITGFTIRNSGGLGGTGIRIKSDNNEIHGNVLSSNNCYGADVFSGSYNTFYDNIVSENDFGMWLEDGFHNSIFDCEITNNNMGIILDRCSYSNISGNTITSNSRGIDLYYSSYNEVFKNILDENDWAIGLYWASVTSGSSSYNVVRKNVVSNNIGGVVLCGKPSCDVSYNVVAENNVTNNEGGIMCRYYTSKNEIYHNNLIDNIDSRIDEPNNAWDFGNKNYWDNGEEGNYWDDYTEKYPYARPRLFRPWIWNIPYRIVGDGYIRDRYPLVKQYDGPGSVVVQRFQSLFNN